MRSAYRKAGPASSVMSLDVMALVDRAIRLGYDANKIEGLDASLDMPTAKNFYQWLMDVNFCGEERFSLYPKQIFVLAMAFEEYCPMPTCTDMRFFQNVLEEPHDQIFDRVTLLEHGKCPNCGGNKLEYLEEGLFHGVDEVALCLGQRSGKTSMTAGMMLTYILHHYLQLPESPAKYLGLKPGQQLYATLVASSAKQAMQYPWTDFRKMYAVSKWFAEYNRRLTRIADEEGWEIEPVKVLDTKVEYQHRNLCIGFEPPNKKTLRGATRFFAMIDEFGWFSEDDKRETASASETEDALGNALSTVRAAMSSVRARGNMTMPSAFLCKSSSPHYVGDPIMRAVQDGKKDPTTFVLHLPTWDVNPNFPAPWVPGSPLTKEFQKRPEDAERSFGANPPFARSPFHKNKAVFAVLSKDYEPLVDHRIVEFRDDIGLEYVYAEVKMRGPGDKIPRVISCDPGVVNNSFGITLQHLSPTGDGVVDVAIKIQPKAGADSVPVHFSRVLQHCIMPLIEEFNVVAVIYDRWQSISHVNDINSNPTFAARVKAIQAANPHITVGKRDKIPNIGGALQHSLNYSDFLQFDGVLPKVSLPRLERPWESVKETSVSEALDQAPTLELLFQTATVRDTGAKVTKPEVGDDDLYRSMVNGFTYMMDEDRKDFFSNHTSMSLGPAKRSRGPLMLVVSRGRGGGAVSNGRGPTNTGVSYVKSYGSSGSRRR